MTFQHFADVDVELQQFKSEMKSQVYPSLKRGKQCTMLLVSNLAYPQWVSVSCHQRILRHVVCVKERTQGNGTTTRITEVLVPKLTCRNSTFLRNKTCYKLVWYNSAILEKFSKKNTIVDHVCNMCARYKMTVNNIGNITIFKFLFTAVESKRLVLLTLSEKSYLINLLFYKRLWLTHKYEMKTVNIKKATGYFVCETRVKKMSFSFENCFLHLDGVFMSSMYLSD